MILQNQNGTCITLHRLHNAKRRFTKRPSVSTSSLSESELEAKFHNLILEHGLPRPTQQYVFHPSRRWRLDFAWPALFLAVEIQGFGPTHNSYNGMSSDYEKHNNAILLGWRILYFMAHDLKPPNTIATINTVRIALGVQTYHSKEHKPKLNPIDAARRQFYKAINRQQEP